MIKMARAMFARSAQKCANTICIPLLFLCGGFIVLPALAQTATDEIKANAAAKSETQAGFSAAETFSSSLGQPEVATALKLLLSLFDFVGYFGNTDMTAAEIAELQRQMADVEKELKQDEQSIAALTDTVAGTIDNQLIFQVHELHRQLMLAFIQLHPSAATDPVICKALKLQSCTRVNPDATPQVAHQVAMAAAGIADDFIDQQPSLWIGADVQTLTVAPDPVTGEIPPSPPPKLIKGLKPYPALQTYLQAIEVWITAMEVESGGTPLGYQAIKRTYGPALARHLAFLKTRVQGGYDPTGKQPPADPKDFTDPLPDKITAELRCKWHIGSKYPDDGICHANGVCENDIARTVVALPNVVTWQNTDPNALCTIRSDTQIPGEDGLHETYGTAAIAAMADVIDRVVRLGTARQQLIGTFGPAPFLFYALNAEDQALFFDAVPGKVLDPGKVVTTTLTDATSLLPGGGNWFYTLDTAGTLRWYQFFNDLSTPSKGPTVVGTGFNGYKQIFGGGDGVIYAIDANGALIWRRHNGFATGGGTETMSAPLTVGSGWGQFVRVFSVGKGIIYAVRPDGALVWYKHEDYLSGISRDLTGGVRIPTNIRPHAHWIGPIVVGSGWAKFINIVGGENGIILAEQADGTLLEYHHRDYDTGVSTTRVLGQPAELRPQAHWEGPTAIASGWQQYGSMAAMLPAPSAPPPIVH